MKNAAILFALLFSAWLLWSGAYSIPGYPHFHGLVLALGVASCALVVWLHMRMERQHGDRSSYVGALGFVTYLPWLLWQIVVSNLQIARVILSPRLPIDPRLVQVEAPLETDFGWAVLANSITLTPGTLSLDVRSGRILVHALTRESAEGLTQGGFVERVRRMERPPAPRPTPEDR